MAGFGFSLEWDEIDEETRNEKIDAYLEYIYPTFYDDLDEPPMTLAQFQEEPDNRETAEEHISAHFPIYF